MRNASMGGLGGYHSLTRIVLPPKIEEPWSQARLFSAQSSTSRRSPAWAADISKAPAMCLPQCSLLYRAVWKASCHFM